MPCQPFELSTLGRVVLGAHQPQSDDSVFGDPCGWLRVRAGDGYGDELVQVFESAWVQRQQMLDKQQHQQRLVNRLFRRRCLQRSAQSSKVTERVEHAPDGGTNQFEVTLREGCLRLAGCLPVSGQSLDTVHQCPGFVAVTEVQCNNRQMRCQIDGFINELGVH